MVDHSGCSGKFENGAAALQKVRNMGFNIQFMPAPLEITCTCGEAFTMDKFETKCPACGMIYAVTPCSSHDAANVMPAGKDI